MPAKEIGFLSATATMDSSRNIQVQFWFWIKLKKLDIWSGLGLAVTLHCRNIVSGVRLQVGVPSVCLHSLVYHRMVIGSLPWEMDWNENICWKLWGVKFGEGERSSVCAFGGQMSNIPVWNENAISFRRRVVIENQYCSHYFPLTHLLHMENDEKPEEGMISSVRSSGEAGKCALVPIDVAWLS